MTPEPYSASQLARLRERIQAGWSEEECERVLVTLAALEAARDEALALAAWLEEENADLKRWRP